MGVERIWKRSEFESLATENELEVVQRLPVNVMGLPDPYQLQKRMRKTTPKNESAIYFLFRQKELTYIGKSVRLMDRMREHKRTIPTVKKGYVSGGDHRKRNPRIIPPKIFDRWSCLYLSQELIEFLEPHYIALYNPQDNQVYAEPQRNKNGKQLSFAEVYY